jgi:hypothetical protein
MPEAGSEDARIARVTAALAMAESDSTHTLCRQAARLVGVSGAGVVLVSGGRPLGNVCVSDPITDAVEDIQYTLGEGPCIEAYRTRSPVLVPDLADAGPARWPGFGEGARANGVLAAFGFPLLVHTICVGALNLYCTSVGSLSDEQYSEAVAVAQVASSMVLDWQAVAGPGSLARQLEQIPVHRAAVHQAAGIVSVQGAMTVDDALAWIRAYAFAEAESIGNVASAIVARQLHYGDGS